MIRLEVFLRIALWVLPFLYSFALMPQIYVNFKHKTTKGLSSLMLWAYMNGYIAFLFHVFCLNLPISYKIALPISCSLVMIIVVQTVYYDLNIALLRFCLMSITAAIALIPFAMNYPYMMGHIMGWASVIFWSTYQIPQLIKMFYARSVHGYSFVLASVIGLGNVFEGVGVILMNLPIQTLFSNIRGILMYFIFCWQFWTYGMRPRIFPLHFTR